MVRHHAYGMDGDMWQGLDMWQGVGAYGRGDGRVWGHLAGCGRGGVYGRGSPYGIDGDMWQGWEHVVGYGGMWQGVGVCGRGSGLWHR